MRGPDVGRKEFGVVRVGFIEMPVRISSPAGDDMRKCHFQQAFVAASAAKPARLDTAKWHPRISRRDDKIVDQNKTVLNSSRQRTGARDVA